VGLILDRQQRRRYHTLANAVINPLSPELNPICYLLALLAHDFLHVSRIRVKSLTLRLLTSYIYDISNLRVNLTFMGKNFLTYIQHDATLRSLFYPETALHVSGGITTHHQERKQLYLQHLVFVTPLLLPAATSIAAGSSNGVTNTRCCRYSCLRSWWLAELPPKTCRAVSR
jgi:hypothetical protein